ncbi:cytochrome P450 [Xylogone sp. PMI_703]|nr:cytochrome P450 [Xylogone sp. PMI_703]
MYSTSILVVLLLPAVLLLNSLISLAKNIRIARATGLPYVIVPVHPYSPIPSLIFTRTILRLCDKILPEPSTTSWRRITAGAWWKMRHVIFADLGSDSFLTVSPSGITLSTADANVAAQVIARGNDFPKPTQMYERVNIYGKNVVSSSGATWRRHRAIAGPAFSEKNNHLVWNETLEITQNVVNSWVSSGSGLETITTVASDAMRLSLEVIGRAGLGQTIEWPKAGQIEETKKLENLPPGHELSFTEALQYVLRNIFLVMISAGLPPQILENSPWKVVRKSYQAYLEWGKYLDEMVASKKEAIRSRDDETSTVDLLGQLLKAQEADKSNQSATTLSDSEVTGNLFVFILAGHETSANSIHFSLIYLALHPNTQRKAQKELSEIFRDRPISEWEYERDLPQLFNSYLYAIMNEQLRLIGAIAAVPKSVGSEPQNLVVNNKDIVLPPGTIVRLCNQAIHRNPRFWPSRPPKNPARRYFPFNKVTNDLDEFVPDRWVKPKDTSTRSSKASSAYEIYTPPKGAFIPFSDGQRACLGKRFAQVEILAALAVILTQYSVELAVDEWASDEEVRGMSKQERKETWVKAREKTEWALHNKLGNTITMQLNGAHIPVRFVRKGEERFGDL